MVCDIGILAQPHQLASIMCNILINIVDMQMNIGIVDSKCLIDFVWPI